MITMATAASAATVTRSVPLGGRPRPSLVFGTTIRIAEAYADSPEAGASRDGCLAAEMLLKKAPVVSKVVFDAARGRLRQTNSGLQRNPTQNITNIGRWDLPVPQEWDLLTTAGGDVSCETEPLPKVLCPNGTLPPSCPPKFGSWGALNPFTSIVGMWYPNTTKLEGGSTSVYDTYQFEDTQRTLLPDDPCGQPSVCTMERCGGCTNHDGSLCTSCPCKGCLVKVNVTRNYTYVVKKKPQADGTHQMLRYQFTQAIPLTKNGTSPGKGRDCFIFDWSKDWRDKVTDEDFEPPMDVKCT